MTTVTGWPRSTWALVACAYIGAIGIAGPMPAASAQEAVPTQVGIVDPSSGEPLRGGGSVTAFELDLPDAASCPGDTAEGDYRVQSYMVPALDDLSLTFDGLGPTPYSIDSYEAFRQPLYDPNGEPFDVGVTAEADAPGEPGLILDVPEFAFAAYPPGLLPVGPYLVGLACTRHNEVSSRWEARLEVVEPSADEPAGFRWIVAGPVAEDANASSMAVVLGAVAVVAVAGAVLFLRRRRTSASTLGSPT